MAERKASKAAALEIAPVQTTTAVFAILGKRPVILNRLSEKTRGKKRCVEVSCVVLDRGGAWHGT